MAYGKQYFTNGQVLTAEQLNYIEDGVLANESAGEAVRAQIENAKSNIDTIKDALGENGLLPKPSNSTVNGVTFQVVDNGSYKIYGVAESRAYLNMYVDDANLPENIKVNGKYRVKVSGLIDGVLSIYLYFFDGNGDALWNTQYKEDGTYDIVVPENTAGMSFRFRVEAGGNVGTEDNPTKATADIFHERLIDKIKEIDKVDLRKVFVDACNNTEPTKILTWVDDDTDATGIETAKTICDNLGVKCTFATITSQWNETLINRLKEFQRKGFHIVSHSNNHSRWYSEENKFTPEELEEDLIISLERLREEGFLDSDMLVYPGSSAGRDDVNVPTIVKKWCRYGVYSVPSMTGVDSGRGREQINRMFFDFNNTPDVSYYTTKLDSVTNGSWVVIGSHSKNTDTGEFDVEKVTEVLQYAISNGFKIMTLNEALKYREKYYTIQDLLGM
ncbi:MAG: polysaccharide deacetylase family protein [Oscillospiraceae bacterium]|nr:polysaccharide deacetylase family protein [Oscillospiraceae bacterium]